MRDYKQLAVWQRAHKLSLAVYALRSHLPREEKYALAQQMWRASYSIPSNIAEGCAKESDADFCRYLQIALGSACELEYFLVLCIDLKLLGPEAPTLVEVIEVKKMLTRFIQNLEARR